ncbi:hypothetical protein [Haliea salexigens]|uniref:hypothetical protein n=1 Tax=Haliea salexigens TaxID=287487 RepID=UPI001181D682|nr:hypothetical protein [Haliea salexigens]
MIETRHLSLSRPSKGCADTSNSAELKDSMGQKFPEILPEKPRDYWPADPWEKKTQIHQWISENKHRFAFSRDRIIAQFQEYKGVRPGPNLAGIYVLGLSGDIGYVGKATSIARRMWAHKLDRKHFTHYWCLTGIPQDIIGEVEGFFIETLEPVLNSARVWAGEQLHEYAAEIKRDRENLVGPIYPPPYFD